MTCRYEPPHEVETEAMVASALREDLGLAGDITTNALVPKTSRFEARIVAREPGFIAGLFMAQRVFARLDPTLELKSRVDEGDGVNEKTVVAHLSGSARAILTGERTALNFLGRLSGIATRTRAYAAEIRHTPAVVVSTRKTTPGLRALAKYAVVAGGGGPHRYGLYDAVLVKDNHIAAAGGVRQAVEGIRTHVGPLVPIQVEVDALEQLETLLPLNVDAVLLDNMNVETLCRAVEMCAGRVLTEASGGITLDNIRAVAESGVDRISVGALTHSAPTLDVALDSVMDRATRDQ